MHSTFLSVRVLINPSGFLVIERRNEPRSRKGFLPTKYGTYYLGYTDRNLTDGEEEIDVVGAHVVLGEVHDGALQRHLAVMVGGNLKHARIDGDTILKINININ